MKWSKLVCEDCYWKRSRPKVLESTKSFSDISFTSYEKSFHESAQAIEGGDILFRSGTPPKVIEMLVKWLYSTDLSSDVSISNEET
jgi:hypothetical protein